MRPPVELISRGWIFAGDVGGQTSSVVGIAVGVTVIAVILVLLCLAVVVLLIRRRRRRRRYVYDGHSDVVLGTRVLVSRRLEDKNESLGLGVGS